MQPVSHSARLARQRGFTALEALVTVAVLGIVLAIGLPNMRGWLGATTATGAGQFYAEGFTLARSQALANNSRSRLVLDTNAQSGQFDWQVDVCFPVADDPCGVESERWSTVEDAAAVPEDSTIETKSTFRSAAALPNTAALTVTPNSTAKAVYFTEMGWVDGSKPAVTRLTLGPGSADAEDTFTDTAVVLTLAGAVVTCDPAAAAGNSRRCP